VQWSTTANCIQKRKLFLDEYLAGRAGLHVRFEAQALVIL
jgi:hypothetical protein